MDYKDVFDQHGVVFKLEQVSDTQWVGNCPFCRKPGHFYLQRNGQLWDCKFCGEKGNLIGFLTRTAERYETALSQDTKKLFELCRRRGLEQQTLEDWGVGWSGAFYSIPMQGNENKTVWNIKRYFPKNGKNWTTKGCRQSLIVPKKVHNSEIVWLCEGEWDAMSMHEALRHAKRHEDVIAVPGSHTLPRNCLSLLANKDVRILFDNDKAGYTGAERTKTMLEGVANCVSVAHWPDGTTDGFDISDLYKQDKPNFLDNVEALLVLNEPQAPALQSISPKQAEHMFRKWLKMRDAECLHVMFGTVVANRLQGDPLWLFLVAPPGGMKSELIMSLNGVPEVISKTSLTPKALISGAHSMGDSDPSLLPKLHGKVLAIKDFTTLLTMNSIARDEILGTLRDAYDGRVEKEFGNHIVRAYDCSFGIIAGVTPIIETASSTSTLLGERFIKYRMSSSGLVQTSRDVVLQAIKNLRDNDLMRKELNEAALAALAFDTPDSLPEVPDDMIERIAGLAQWVAMLRGVVSRERYTGQVNFKPMSEIGTRLAKQLLKLGYGITMFLREDTMSPRTYRTLTHVARSTAPDRVEEIVKQMYIHTTDTVVRFPTTTIANWTRFPEPTVRYLLQDLELLHITRKEGQQWRIAQSLLELMKSLRLYATERKWKAK